MKKNRFKIDFIGVGAPRCGTTWISKCLSQHPQICFSSRKETHFFDKEYNYKKGLKFYKKFFKHCDKRKVKGEFTPSYYLNEDIAKNIKQFFPNVKILICLRNPVDRAISHYKHRNKGAKSGTLEMEIKRNFNKRIIQSSFYYGYLSKFLPYFDGKNILILVYEDSLKDPYKFIKTIYKFLGVNRNFIPSFIKKKINTSNRVGPRYLFINRTINKRKKLRKYKACRITIKILKLVGANLIIKTILKINRSKNKKPVDVENIINNSTRNKLKNMYRNDIEKLEKLINKDLSIWK